MKNLRFWIIALIVWLIFFFNIERVNSPINIRAYTYIFITGVVAATLVLPRLQHIPFLVLLATPIPIYLWLKATIEKGAWYENLIEGFALPLTVTQVAAIILTGLLARQILYALYEFEETIANITFGYMGKLPKPFSEGQGTMYREVKRARRYHRPLAVIALKVNEEDIQVAIPDMVRDVQQTMMRQYVMAGISRILDDNMHDFDTIALRDNHFILVLPEIAPDEAIRIAQHLEEAVKEKMRINLEVGTATFPDEAMTFESLVELALQNTEASIEIPAQPSRLANPHLGDVRL
jgi:GGDEF domain-containing protein